MSSTEGLIGFGKYNPVNRYKKYNSEHYYVCLQNIFKQKKKSFDYIKSILQDYSNDYIYKKKCGCCMNWLKT